MPVVLYHSGDPPDRWREAFQACAPSIRLRVYPEVGEKSEVEAFFGFKPPHGLLASLPNLRVIVSKGFGVDHIFADPQWPKHVPIVRMADPSAIHLMTQYVVWAVLRHHRQVDAFAAAQAKGEWTRLPVPDTALTPVGVLGLGVLGRDAARALGVLGFPVTAWSRTLHRMEGVACVHGEAALPAFLANSRILVCLLALTRETEGILNARTFAALPKGAYVVNAARGGHVVEDDLLAALDSGHLAGATLDVARVEPLPKVHRFWTHPKVTLTPHIAADAIARTAAPLVAEAVRRAMAGEPLLDQVDPVRGY